MNKTIKVIIVISLLILLSIFAKLKVDTSLEKPYVIITQPCTTLVAVQEEIPMEKISDELLSEFDNARNPFGDIYYYEFNIKDLYGNYIYHATAFIDGIETEINNGVISGFTKADGVELLINAVGFVSFYDDFYFDEYNYIKTIVLEEQSEVYSILNNAELRPYETDDENLNSYIDYLFLQLFTETDSTFNKVLKCYNWIVDNIYYKYPEHWKRPYQDYYWSCAYQCLINKYGTCNCYSAAFTAMTRKIGLESYIVEGQTAAYVGGSTSHQWVVVIIDNEQYIFDPQVEDAIANRTANKDVTYVRFCLKTPDSKYRYNKQKVTKHFGNYLQEHGHFIEES